MMKRFLLLCSFFFCFTNICLADVNGAIDNFFSQISSNSTIDQATIAHNQSAGVLTLGGIATRSQSINLDPMHFTPPSFNSSCGNINFYSGSFSFMTNTDQLVTFMQNTLMSAGITAAMTALKSVTPNIAGTIQSMFDAAQKMLNMFNSSCQLGMALGNAGDSWVYDRLAKGKSYAHSQSGDASGAEINSTTGGSSGSGLGDNMGKVAEIYHDWVSKNASMTGLGDDGIAQQMATKYGSVIWKGLQAMHLYTLPIDPKSTLSTTPVPDVANLVISLVGDLILYSPTDDGTGLAVHTIPPSITDLDHFIDSTSGDMQVYDCQSWNTISPSECIGGSLSGLVQYPESAYAGGIMKKIQQAMQSIQSHFTSDSPLTDNDLLIIAISPIPIFAYAQTLDDIGLSSTIEATMQPYAPQISFEILQKLISISLNLAVQAATTRSNPDTQRNISDFIQSIVLIQNRVNTISSKYIKYDLVDMLQKLNFLRSYAQNQMSGEIMQKVNFAKQLGTQ